MQLVYLPNTMALTTGGKPLKIMHKIYHFFLKAAAWTIVGGYLICFSVLAEEPTIQAQCSPEQERYIWQFLLNLTENPKAAAGIMGNLYYESYLQCSKTEDGIPLECAEEYTYAVDSGEYGGFITDGYGYGLAQWSYSGRKQRLLELANSSEVSVSDLDVQLQLIAEELENFNMLYRISHTDSIQFASDYFLLNFENPQAQDEEMRNIRGEIGQAFYEKYADIKTEECLTDAQKYVVQIASHSDLYSIVPEDGNSFTWASEVYQEAGFPLDSHGSVRQSAACYGLNRELSAVPVGAAVYGKNPSEEGYVGIYIGDHKVCHYDGKIRIDSLDDWISQYQGYCWGWIGGTDLSAIT